MKKFTLLLKMTVFSALIILGLIVTKSKSIVDTNIKIDDECSQWESLSSNYIQFRWCKDPSMFNETTYQFHNGYRFKVWYFFKIDFTNGESTTGNTILGSEEESDKGAMYKRIPSSWTIVKKQKQDESGKWVNF